MSKIKFVLTSRDWWRASLTRAVKTFAQTLGMSLVVGTPIQEMQWFHALSIAAGAGVLSLITSLAGLPEVEEVKPSD